MVKLFVLAFSAIQGLLGLRLVLPAVPVPEQLQPLVPTLINITDLLMSPFSGFALPGAIGGFPGLGGGQMDTSVLPALIGWSVVELVVLGGLRLMFPPRSGQQQGWDAGA
jgi:hypothetical protein